MIFLLGLIFGIVGLTTCYADQTIIAQKVDKAPVIDGTGNDPVWAKAPAIVTHDKLADIDVTLKAIYTDKEIFFLVIFPDPDESRDHKILFWDKDLEMYKTGPEREDSFVLKWNMEPKPMDLSVDADMPYVADIWFWKAHRTDPVGYADDKRHILSISPEPDSLKRISKGGKILYLSRPGDEGSAAYQGLIYEEYKGDKISKYEIVSPTGSRADVKARGTWKDGKWTVEFERAINTGNPDDIQFDTSKSYLFGISRYEIAGRNPDPKSTQPLFGAGDITEDLTLTFGK